MVRGSVVGRPLPGGHKLLNIVEEMPLRPLELRFMTANLLIPELGKLPVMARTHKESRRIGLDGPSLVFSSIATMGDDDSEELRESFRVVMRKGARYEREE